jgi:hypothetical protein
LDLDPRQLGLVLARARAINGLVMLVAPGLVARLVFGRAANGPALRAALRIVGIRDVVLGVGAITTLKEHTMDAEWVGMGAVADAVDGVVALVTPGLIPRARLVALIGGGAAAQGLFVARTLADERTAGASEIDS